MGEMDEKVVLVTGATNGIGKAAALELAKKSAKIVIVGRNAAKTQATVSEIKLQSGSTAVESLVADLSSLAEVRRLADEFRQRYTRLDVLVNNAGAYFASRQVTVDGFEQTFALNHLSYFLLTNLLLDMIKASAPSRIVNVASDAHRLSERTLLLVEGLDIERASAWYQEVTADLPEQAMHSFKSASNEIHWALLVDIQPERGPKVTLTYPVRVLPPA